MSIGEMRFDPTQSNKEGSEKKKEKLTGQSVSQAGFEEYEKNLEEQDEKEKQKKRNEEDEIAKKEDENKIEEVRKKVESKAGYIRNCADDIKDLPYSTRDALPLINKEMESTILDGLKSESNKKELSRNYCDALVYLAKKTKIQDTPRTRSYLSDFAFASAERELDDVTNMVVVKMAGVLNSDINFSDKSITYLDEPLARNFANLIRISKEKGLKKTTNEAMAQLEKLIKTVESVRKQPRTVKYKEESQYHESTNATLKILTDVRNEISF